MKTAVATATDQATLHLIHAQKRLAFILASLRVW